MSATGLTPVVLRWISCDCGRARASRSGHVRIELLCLPRDHRVDEASSALTGHRGRCAVSGCSFRHTADCQRPGKSIPASAACKHVPALLDVSRGRSRARQAGMARPGALHCLSRRDGGEERLVAAPHGAKARQSPLHPLHARQRGDHGQCGRQCDDPELRIMSQRGWNNAHGGSQRGCRKMPQLSRPERTALRSSQPRMCNVSRATYRCSRSYPR